MQVLLELGGLTTGSSWLYLLYLRQTVNLLGESLRIFRFLIMINFTFDNSLALPAVLSRGIDIDISKPVQPLMIWFVVLPFFRVWLHLLLIHLLINLLNNTIN